MNRHGNTIAKHKALKASLFSALLFFLSFSLHAQFGGAGPGTDQFDMQGEELNIGGDIFTDFHEDTQEKQVLEDERFYRYGRFFSVQFSLGLTTYDGNRGTAYENDPPTYGFGLNFFQDFRNSYGLGFEYSKHHMFLPDPVEGFNTQNDPNGPGFVDISQLRVYFSYRHYIDTSDLGTAITYANPYFTGRMEYWYTTSKFVDQDNIPDDSGGGFGFGLGFGMEFPIKVKENYLGVEFLFHSVNYHDKYTQDYRAINEDQGDVGYADLTGNAYSTMLSYVINW